MRHVVGKIILLLALSLLLVGCADFVDQDQINTVSGNNVVVDTDHSVGQTFVARHAGLSGVEFLITPAMEFSGTILLHLRATPFSTEDLATAEVYIEPKSPRNFYRFTFPAIQDSNGRYYYVFLEPWDATGQLTIPLAQAYVYWDGAFYVSHEAQDNQAAFRLVYEPLLIIRHLIALGFRWLIGGGLGVVFFFFAGYPLVCARMKSARLDFTSTLLWAIGSFLGVWVVFIFLTSGLNFFMTAMVVRLVVGMLWVMGIILFVRDRAFWMTKGYWVGQKPSATFLFWGVSALILTLRLFLVNNVIALPGSDTYHHTLIAQLFLEQGGIPQNYEPYARLGTFCYHFGFHSIVALFRWLLGAELLSTTKTVAVLLNGAIAMGAGLLAELLLDDRWPAVFATIFVGLVMVSPFCMLLWGGFTQIAGVFFLVWVVCALVWQDYSSFDYGVSAALIAAMVFSHVRMVFPLMAFVLIGVYFMLRRGKPGLRAWLLIGALSAVLILPWAIHEMWIQHDPYELRSAVPFRDGYSDLAGRLGLHVLGFASNKIVIFFTLLFGVLGWVKSKSFSLRWVELWFLSMVGMVGLTTTLNFFIWDVKVLLITAIPAAIIIGWGFAFFCQHWFARRRWFPLAGLILVLLVCMGIGVMNFPEPFYRDKFYVRQHDLLALDWVIENTPQDSKFLVNGITFDWAEGLVVGGDAGYWIPLLTGRRTTVPPMIYIFEWRNADSLVEDLDLTRKMFLAQDVSLECDVGQAVASQGIDYVIVESGQGLLNPYLLSENSYLQVVYRLDRLWIFKVISPVQDG